MNYNALPLFLPQIINGYLMLLCNNICTLSLFKVHYSIAFAACAKGNMPPEKALALLFKMKREGLNSDTICYTQVMHALSRGRRWKQVLQLLRHSMPTNGIQPTVVSYNVAINACSRCGQFEWAKNLLEEMKQAGLTPDGWSYCSAIRGVSALDEADPQLDG